ncbi:MAG: 7-cyano-7-deazaguanine synthase [Candidatus Midichloriaceae bacterium]|jgi:7-cyano-7-deazaguanine synthase
MKNKKAVVLLSGGLDSSTTLAIVKERGYIPHCLSFDYGQKQRIEIESAKKIKELISPNSKHQIINIHLDIFGKSALTDNIEVPKGRSEKEISDGIPITYVPASAPNSLKYGV